jgi:pyrroloquinoline-quinone synthase
VLDSGQFKRDLVRAMRTRQTVEHPILAELMRPEPNYPLARLLAGQIYKLTTMFERYIAALFYRCPVREFRAKLAENLYEEVTGRLSKTDGHLELMERFIFAIGLTRDDLDATVPLSETQDLIDYRVRLVDDPIQYHKAVAAVMITSEGQTIQRKDGQAAYQLFAKAYNLTAHQLEFFAVHAAEDIEHVKDGLELAVLVCKTEEMQREAIAAARETSEKFWSFYDGIERAYRAGLGARD